MSTPYRKLSTGRTEKRSRKVFCLWLFFVVASVELEENQYSTEWVDRKHSSSIWGSFCLQVDFHSVFRLILILSSDWCMQPHPPHRPVIVWTRRKQYYIGARNLKQLLLLLCFPCWISTETISSPLILECQQVWMFQCWFHRMFPWSNKDSWVSLCLLFRNINVS